MDVPWRWNFSTWPRPLHNTPGVCPPFAWKSPNGVLAILSLMVAVSVSLRPEVLSAQVSIGGTDNVFLMPDRRVLGQMIKARALLEQERYGEAVAKLGRLLKDREDGGPVEDYFFQPDKLRTPEIHRSLKREAQRLIGEMPPEGLQQYEMQFGSEARRILNEAVALGNRAGLARVARCYFHTRAGREATLLLGLYHLDHAEPLAGALTLQRLRKTMDDTRPFEPALSLALATCWLRVGMRDEAAGALVALYKQHPEMVVELGGARVMHPDRRAERLEWLAEIVGTQAVLERKALDSWSMFRGNAARNAPSAGSTPLLNLCWKVLLANDPNVEGLLKQRRQHYQKQGHVILPGLHPLAVDDFVLMRTCRNLLAVDFATGKRLWEVPVDDPIEKVLGGSEAGVLLRQSPHLAEELARRVWQDVTYGTLSSDGRLVFSIEDLPLQVSPPSRTVIINNRRVNAPGNRQYNRLAAREIWTGKLKWDLGGADDQFALRQAKTFFLGPPLPLMGRLYVLGETEGEIRLMVLDPERKGELVWEQKLATTEQTIQRDPVRRLAGVSPSYADGILVCPTSVGAAVAVDMASRSLVWGYRYPRRNDYSYGSHPFGMPFNPRAIRWPRQGWADGCAVIADGRVLLTPVESDELHCVDLRTGELLWKQPRGDNLYLAHVYKDNAVLVGRREVRAFSLSETIEVEEIAESDESAAARNAALGRDPFAVPAAVPAKKDEAAGNQPGKKVIRPKPAWDGRAIEFPEGAVPSGRGFFGNGHYFVPLSTAEVVALDLETGRIVHRSKSRAGIVPGNLVCYKGRVISQGYENVEIFYQLESARREVTSGLAADPDSPKVLRLSGEILLDEGKHSEAIACFRKAYEAGKKAQSDDMPRSRDLLRDALLDGLRADFAAHRNRGKEIEDLLDSAEQRAQYLRLTAMGLKQAGEWQAALDRYLELVDLDPDKLPIETLSKSRMVRRDRWIQAELASLREVVTDVALLDERIEGRLRAALEKDDINSLKRFLDYFGNHPAARQARRRLVEKLSEADRLLEAEMVLWQDYQSSDPALAGVATAELAEMLHKAGRNNDAAVCYRRLADELAEAVCRRGKTGQELFDALADSDPVQPFLSRDDPWPTGRIRRRLDTSKRSRPPTYGRYAMQFRGNTGPFFRETSLRFDASGRRVLGYDAFGRECWQVLLTASSSSHSVPGFNRSVTHGLACGHLLLVSMGHRIAAVDTLSNSGKSPKLLWNKDPTDASLDAIRFGRFPAGLPNPFGRVPNLGGYRQTTLLGPVTSRYICFQRFRNLVAVDPLSGEPLWIQDDIEPASTLFGDDRFVFVVPPQKDVATVFRALDGKLLGERKVPRSERINYDFAGKKQTTLLPFSQSSVATIGSCILLWKESGVQPVLRLFDVWKQEDAWPPRKFAKGAKMCMIGHEAVGVLEPGDEELDPLGLGLHDDKGGRFVLVSLPDGKTRFETELEPAKGLTDFSVLRSGDGYALVTHTPADNPRAASIRPVPTTLSKQIVRGRVYMLDARGGKLWPKPFELKEQHLLLDQPSRLPILTFACLVVRPAKSGSRGYELSVIYLDKRTGRVAYPEKPFKNTSLLNVVGDPEKKTVDITTNTSTIHLTFTDDSSVSPGAAEGLFKALQKVVEEQVREELEGVDSE